MNLTSVFQPFALDASPQQWEYPVRVLASFFSVGVIAVERQMARSPVGFGTFLILGLAGSVGAVVAMVAVPGTSGVFLSGLVSSVGFLGAGALIRSSATNRMNGFTTGSLVVGATVIGIAFGVGMYILALMMWALVLVVVAVDRLLAFFGQGSHASLLQLEIGFVPEEEDSTLAQQYAAHGVVLEPVPPSLTSPPVRRRGRVPSQMRMGRGVVVVNKIELMLQRLRLGYTLREVVFDAKEKKILLDLIVQSTLVGIEELVTHLDVQLGLMGISVDRLVVGSSDK